VIARDENVEESSRFLFLEPSAILPSPYSRNLTPKASNKAAQGQARYEPPPWVYGRFDLNSEVSSTNRGSIANVFAACGTVAFG
jgi:hypothetical protein